MWLTLLAVAVGIAAGLVSGGTLRGLGRVRPVAPWLIVVWVGLLVATLVIDIPAAGTWFLLAHVAGIAFAILNRYELPGIAVLGFGIGLNLTVIILNDAMPYRVSSLIAAGVTTGGDETEATAATEATAETESLFRVNAHTRPERDTDRLLVLADVIPFNAGPIHEVLSIGDIVAALGAAYTTYRAITERERRRPTTGQTQSRQTKSGQPQTATQYAASQSPRNAVDEQVRVRRLSNPQFSSLQFSDSHDETVQLAPTEGEARLLIDLTADRAMHPDRYTTARSATHATGTGIDVLADTLAGSGPGSFEQLVNITDGSLPGDTFWEARQQQLNRGR